MIDRPVAVVTGARRGLGRETVRQLADRGWAVVLTARTLATAEAAAAELRAELPEGAVVEAAVLDVTDAGQAAAVAALVAERFGRLDAVVNNAGVVLEQGWPSALDADPELVRRTFDNNTVGCLVVAQALVPLLREGAGGNLVMVSSGMGGLTEMGSHHVAYRLSKTGQNVLTRVLHNELGDKGVRVNSVCPGFVRTELSPANAQAPRGVAEGAAGIVWAATLGPDGPSGGFFRDGEPIPW